MVSGLTPVGPLLWQAEADTELTLTASPTTAVGQKALALAKKRYSTVQFFHASCAKIFDLVAGQLRFMGLSPKIMCVILGK